MINQMKNKFGFDEAMAEKYLRNRWGNNGRGKQPVRVRKNRPKNGMPKQKSKKSKKSRKSKSRERGEREGDDSGRHRPSKNDSDDESSELEAESGKPVPILLKKKAKDRGSKPSKASRTHDSESDDARPKKKPRKRPACSSDSEESLPIEISALLGKKLHIVDEVDGAVLGTCTSVKDGADGVERPVGWEPGHVLVTNVKAAKGADAHVFDNNIIIADDGTQHATVVEAADSLAPVYIYWNFLKLLKK